jgi:hypothetical protein
MAIVLTCKQSQFLCSLLTFSSHADACGRKTNFKKEEKHERTLKEP